MSEFAIARSIFSDFGWRTKARAPIVADLAQVMREEEEHHFATLRGALEFLTLHVEASRLAEGLHFDIIRAMLDRDWKWRRIGSLLAFQLTNTDGAAFWDFLRSLTGDPRDFVRRICAEQLGPLARYHADNALPLLNACLRDQENASVQAAAHESLLSLDAQTAFKAADLLIRERPIGDESAALAAEMLLSPLDSLSPLLQEKTRWLVQEITSSAIGDAVIAYLDSMRLPPYQDLYALEELETAFQVGWHRAERPQNPYLDHVQQLVAPRRQALTTDIARAEALNSALKRVFDFTVKTLGMRRGDSEVVLSARLGELVPQADKRMAFLAQIEQTFKVQLPFLHGQVYCGIENNFANVTLIRVLVAIAGAAEPFAQGLSATYVVGLPTAYYFDAEEGRRLLRLCQIADDVVGAAASVSRDGQPAITLQTELGKGGLNLEPEERTALRNSAAAKVGVELTAIEHRALTSLGRLALWLWQADLATQQREQALEQKVAAIGALATDAIQQRLSAFEATTLSDQMQRDLALEVQAICQAYADSQPARVADALARLIIWHSENDSPAVGRAFQSLYWRDRDRFWASAEALLQHGGRFIRNAGATLLLVAITLTS